MQKQRTFIFDLDGTLIDSERAALIAWQRAVAEYGATMTEADQGLIVGHGLSVALANVKRHFSLRASTDALFTRLSAHWETVITDGVPATAGAFALLDALDARGVRWGIATNSDYAFAETHLARLGLLERCAALVGSDGVARPKPEPDVYLACALLLEAEPGDCIAVEDSVVGHRAAAAAGMIVVAVPNHWTNAAQFDRAARRYPSLRALQDDLETLLTSGLLTAGPLTAGVVGGA